MFENLIGQDRVAGALREQILDGRLPRAILFHGPRYAGKLTAALETARALSCRSDDARWACTCQSCTRHRVLMDPYTLLLGPRYFLEEIRVCSSGFLQGDSEPTRYLLLRSFRKLLARFEPVLWEGEEAKLSKALSTIESMNEDLVLIQPGSAEIPRSRSSEKPAPPGPALRKALERLQTAAEKLQSFLPAEGYSVQMVRKASYWAHMTSGQDRKVIILEDADRMNDSVRNSLLKILEEPPQNTWFIALSSRLSGILPTLRSRLREYHLSQRSPEEEREVISRIFRIADSDEVSAPASDQSSAGQATTTSGGQASAPRPTSGPNAGQNSASPGLSADDEVRPPGQSARKAEPLAALFSKLGDPLAEKLEEGAARLAQLLSGGPGGFPKLRSLTQDMEAISPGLRRAALSRLLDRAAETIGRQLRVSPDSQENANSLLSAVEALREIQVQAIRSSEYNLPVSTVLEQVYFKTVNLEPKTRN